jgi:hypothetical protein
MNSLGKADPERLCPCFTGKKPRPDAERFFTYSLPIIA